MNAGRELDALVAEKVMGDVPGQALGPRPYSTSILAAWDVVAVVNARTNTGAFALRNALPGWRARFFDPDGGIGWPYDAISDADTAPKAICLAALKAVGIAIPAAPSSREDMPTPDPERMTP